MGDDYQPADALAFPDLKPGEAWGESIIQPRASDLEALLQEWGPGHAHNERTGPFDDEKLTGADVFWLAVRTLAGTAETSAMKSALEWIRSAAAVRLGALHLEGANLNQARLERARLNEVHLEGANLNQAHLEHAHLDLAHLEGANLNGGSLQRATLDGAHLEGANLGGARLERAKLNGAHLEQAMLEGTRLDRARLVAAHLEGACLKAAHLEGANLGQAHCEGTRLPSKEVALLRQWAPKFPNVLSPTNLRMAYFDSGTALNDVTFGTRRLGAVSVILRTILHHEMAAKVHHWA